jgi:hypothetical protein
MERWLRACRSMIDRSTELPLLLLITAGCGSFHARVLLLESRR